jgi:hypothetical protein
MYLPTLAAVSREGLLGAIHLKTSSSFWWTLPKERANGAKRFALRQSANGC